MESERSAAIFKELARKKQEKLEAEKQSIDGAVPGIADMVEGNRLLESRAQAAKNEREKKAPYGFEDSPYRREMSSFSKEISDLGSRRSEIIEEIIPGLEKQAQELKELYKDAPDEIADLMRRVDEEKQKYSEEAAEIPQKRDTVIEAGERRKELEAEINAKYNKIHGDDLGFAVDTTLEQMEISGTPFSGNKSDLRSAVYHELARREEERRDTEFKRQDQERQERDTQWLRDLEQELVETQQRLEQMIEDKAQYLRGETPDGKAFIDKMNANFERIEVLSKKWTFRDKTRDRNEGEIRTLNKELRDMKDSVERHFYDTQADVTGAMYELQNRPSGPAKGSLYEYARGGDYNYHSKELRGEMQEQAKSLFDRMKEIQEELKTKVDSLKDLQPFQTG